MPDGPLDVLRAHFTARLKAAYAKLTGDPMDEFFVSWEKVGLTLGQWLQRELDGDEFREKLYASCPEPILIQLRDGAKLSLRMIQSELERRHS